MISVKHLSFSYGKKQAAIYEGLNLTIKEKERVAILGFNGAGKSTLMKLLLGILYPSSGVVEFNGASMHKKRRKAMEQIGVVWGQKPSLWWDITIKRSYDTLAKLYHLSESDYQRQLAFLDAQLQVSAFWEKPLRKVSLGQRVKAEMMGALLHEPSLLVLDEPFIGLDFITREKVIAMLKDYLATHACTLLLTSHHIDDVVELCDRLVLLDHGKILHDGLIQPLLQEYDHLKELVVSYKKELFIKDQYQGLYEIEEVDAHTSKITIKSKEVQQIAFMKELLNDNEILDFKIKGVSLDYVIKDMVKTA